MWRKPRRKLSEIETDIDPDKDYSKAELDEIADALLMKDARTELCRECDELGEETGESKEVPQEDEDGNPLLDASGQQLHLEFKQLSCGEHEWYQGEGRARGIAGENPILFEEHLYARRRREILNPLGVPDPAIVSGMYYRSHPQGRKINTPEQRKRHGASYYRG